MSPTYQHTQFGTVIVASCGFAVLFMVALLLPVILAGAPAQVALITLIPMLLIVVPVMVLFGSLTIQVEEDQVRWRFGPGPIRGSLRLAEIEDAQIVRNRWWYGWGLRLMLGGGRLYNVSGLDAVELRLTNGKRVRLGTDEPQRLLGAIQEARAMVGGS